MIIRCIIFINTVLLCCIIDLISVSSTGRAGGANLVSDGAAL